MKSSTHSETSPLSTEQESCWRDRHYLSMNSNNGASKFQSSALEISRNAYLNELRILREAKIYTLFNLKIDVYFARFFKKNRSGVEGRRWKNTVDKTGEIGSSWCRQGVKLDVKLRLKFVFHISNSYKKRDFHCASFYKHGLCWHWYFILWRVGCTIFLPTEQWMLMETAIESWRSSNWCDWSGDAETVQNYSKMLCK